MASSRFALADAASECEAQRSFPEEALNHPGVGDEARGASGRDDVDGRSALRGVD